MKRKDLHKAVDSTPLSHELAGQAVDTGIKSLFGLLKGRGKSKEMREILIVLQGIKQRLEIIEGFMARADLRPKVGGGG